MSKTGEVRVHVQSPDNLQALLYDFDVGSDRLQPRHVEWLRKVATDHATSRMRVQLMGMASRTGSEQANQALARRRAESVWRSLRQHDPSLAMPLDMGGTGELLPAMFGVKDRTEDALWRSVFFNLYTPAVSSTAPKPPPPKPPPPKIVRRPWWVEIDLGIELSHIPGHDAVDRRADRIADASHTAMIMSGKINDIRDRGHRSVDETWQLAEVIIRKDDEEGWALAKWSASSVTIIYAWRPNASRCLLRKAGSLRPPRELNDAEALDWLTRPHRTYLLTNWLPL